MKKVTRITHNTVHLVEPGDRLHFKKYEHHREDQSDLPEEFDVTVRGTFLTSIHGPRIFTVEKFGERNDEDDFYLDDDWIITVIEKES